MTAATERLIACSPSCADTIFEPCTTRGSLSCLVTVKGSQPPIRRNSPTWLEWWRVVSFHSSYAKAFRGLAFWVNAIATTFMLGDGACVFADLQGRP